MQASKQGSGGAQRHIIYDKPLCRALIEAKELKTQAQGMGIDSLWTTIEAAEI
jgi:hypothetical protein